MNHNELINIQSFVSDKKQSIKIINNTPFVSKCLTFDFFNLDFDYSSFSILLKIILNFHYILISYIINFNYRLKQNQNLINF